MSSKAKNAEGVLGARIREFRKKNGLTQGLLGAKLNRGESTVRMWELGRSEPDVETLKLLATEFCISIDELVGYNGSPVTDSLSAKEQTIISFYRSKENIHRAIDSLVDASENKIPLYTAANSDEAVPDAIIYLRKEEWERIKNAPETDDPLM